MHDNAADGSIAVACGFASVELYSALFSPVVSSDNNLPAQGIMH